MPSTSPTPPPATPTPVPTPTPAPTATPGPPGPSNQTIHATQGSVNGQTGYSPAEGNTATGGQGSPVDGISCDPTMSNNYHIHIFLGVYNNGTLMAVPPGTGMVNPQPPDPTGFVNFANCFYHLHTHDSSGIVHVEDTNPNNVPNTTSIFTLKTYLDIWGVTADANHFGPFKGPVRVFTSGQVYRGNMNNGVVSASTLTFYGNDPTNVPLYSHELIFVEVGPNYPASLPNVAFYTQF